MTKERDWLASNRTKGFCIDKIIKDNKIFGFIEVKISNTETFLFSAKLSAKQRIDLFSFEPIVFKFTDMSMGSKPSDLYAHENKYLLIVFYEQRNTKIVFLDTVSMDFPKKSLTYDELKNMQSCVYASH